MVILYILGLMGLIGMAVIIIYAVTHDYTKDEKGKDIEDKIDDHLLRP